MNEWLDLSDGGWWHVAGWTMLHFLWLGTLVGLAAGVCRLMLRRAPANVRYAAALTCFVALAALPIGIGIWLSMNQPGFVVEATEIFAPANDVASLAPLPASGSAGGIAGIVSADRPTPPTTIISSEPAIATHPSANPRQSRGLNDVIAVVAGYLPWAWLTGTPLTFLLLTTGVIGAERLRRSSRILDDGPIADACAEIACSLRIGRAVTVAICERIAAPVLVGIVRPMILLPSSALTGWSPEEIEMVLLHELAHVRRWDNLVNLLQRFVEAALFFHPAVWLVSRWVRAEREACCDAVVVGRTHRPHAYAEMLVALAAQLPRSVLFHPAATSAMAAGPLRSRIQRILALDSDPMLVSGKSLGVVMSGLLLAATLAVLNLPTNSKAQESSDAAADAQQNQSLSNLKDLVFAMHKYDGVHRSLPPVAAFDSAGKPLLSWRVLLLPYLGEMELYKEFHMGEPWDSEHNRKLIARMPEVFKNPRIDREGRTNYLAVVGDDCVFDGTRKGIRFAEITDGTSKTIALVEADADRAVEWTKPEDWQFNPEVTGIGALWPDRWLVAWSDGRALPVLKTEPDEVVRTYFARRGDEIILAGEGPEYADAFGGMGGDNGEEMGRGGEFAPGEFVPTGGDFGVALVDVPFEVGAAKLADGDEIKITAVRGTKSTFEPGNEYWIQGTYTLHSQDRATLGASVTAPAATGAITPHDPDQSIEITRGSGEFTLKLPMHRNGWPHVSFYPADGGQSFGGVYFGTGDNVLQEWWKELPESDQSVLRSKFVQTNDNPLETQVYRINNAPNAILRLEWTTKMLERQPSGPKVIFGYNWRDDFTHLEIVTPKAAQEFLKPQILASQTTSSVPTESAKFPSLEDQKLADLAWKRLGVELEAFDPGTLQRVNALGYEGGLKVTPPDSAGFSGPFEKGDILVGLHVWPTTTLEDVSAVLNRDDLRDLSPLKFYVVRAVSDPGFTKTPPPDKVVTGRIQVNFDDKRPRAMAAPAEQYSAERTDAHASRQMAEPATPQPAQTHPPSNVAEIAALRQHVEILVRQLKKVDAQLRAGATHVGPMRDMTAFELALSQGELLLAEGSRDAALDHFKLAGKRAEDALQSVTKEYEANRITQDVLLQAARNVTNVKRRILQIERSGISTSTPAMDAKESVSIPTETKNDNAVTETPQPSWPTVAPAADRYSATPTYNPDPVPFAPLTAGEKARLREEGPIQLKLFVVPNSAPCREAEKLIPEYEKAFPDMIEVEIVDVEANPEVAKQKRIERVPFITLDQGQRGLATIGGMSVFQLEASLARWARDPLRPQARIDQRSILRYNGKTFEEWRTAWQTELSLEKRLEVVKALAAFGASGRGKEAAEAILDVANQLDWSFVDNETAAGRLKQACIDAFVSGRSTEGYRIPTEAWWPLVAPLYENAGDKWTIATYLSYQLPAGEKELIPKLLELSNKSEATRNLALSSLKAIDPQLEDDRVVSRLRSSLTDSGKPPAALRGAINSLLFSRSGGGGGYGPPLQLRWVPELQPLLFHPDPEVRQTARFAIAKAEPRDATPLVEYLIDILDTQGNGKDRREAIRALAALGTRAAAAEEKLKAIARDPKDTNRMPAAAALLALWPDIANWNTNSKLNKLFGENMIADGDEDDISRKLKAEQDLIFGIDRQAYGGGGVF